MSQINKIKKQIENYDYKLDNDINKVFMPSFLYSLHELKHYYNNYEIVANLLVDFFQKIKSYEGRMVDNVLDYFFILSIGFK